MVSLYTYCPTSNAVGDGASCRRSILPTGRLSGECLGVANGDLHVMMTDGAQTYYKIIQSNDIRHMPSEGGGKVLDRVASVLLHPNDETCKVSYKRMRGGSQDSNDTTRIEVSIRKTLLNSIVRPVWEGTLNDIGLICYQDLPPFARCALPDSDRTNASSGLALPIMLGDTINQLHRVIEALRAENRQLEENTLRWKSTSEKLSNKWETEKSELTDRFLTLFNDHKSRHMEVQKELDQIKGKKQRIGGESVVDQKMKRRSRESNQPELEDDNDYVTYENAEVNRLAAGTSLKQSSAKPVASMSQSSGFVNPHTGAREVSHPKDLFSSDDDDDDEMMN